MQRGMYYRILHPSKKTSFLAINLDNSFLAMNNLDKLSRFIARNEVFWYGDSSSQQMARQADSSHGPRNTSLDMIRSINRHPKKLI